MGTHTISRSNRLFWLGRYLERVYTEIETTKAIFDADVDGVEADYAAYCARLGIPGDYENTADFVRRFYFDAESPHSITASLGYAYDNAVVLRETLTSDTLAYIQMAVSAMEKAAESEAPGVALQWVLDDIMAFRGSCEEKIDEEDARSILKTGTSVERLDLYLRLEMPQGRCLKEARRLVNRLYKTSLKPDLEKVNLVYDTMMDDTYTGPKADTWQLIAAVEGLFPVV